ncbi:hypothetical protein IHP33_04095 [Enterococcus faecalis]|uniref:hypothetical protein n=1 Tax=Enterococcus faecalis TaxID=1351 RepID=UPI00177B3F9A|nr:hypothetical protein [Enterococcus faecalis]MBD9844900.1 hypothetical protein [Enterococcus faecalis]
MDSYVSMLFKMLIGCLFVALFLGVWSVGLALSDVSHFKQRVNYAIEQNGGLTLEVMNRLEEYSKNETHGTYKIESEQMGEKLSFGKTVHYTINCTFPTYLPMPKEIKATVQGSAVSQIR